MTQKDKIKLKQDLKELCINLLDQRIQTALRAMQTSQESANSAEKNSAGDKYETSRSMGQLDRDMNAKQLDETHRELSFLQGIDAEVLYEQVTSGAVVHCKQNIFFIAVGLGPAKLGHKTYVLLSLKAPLTGMMLGKKTGDQFTFNGNIFDITDVF